MVLDFVSVCESFVTALSTLLCNSIKFYWFWHEVNYLSSLCGQRLQFADVQGVSSEKQSSEFASDSKLSRGLEVLRFHIYFKICSAFHILEVDEAGAFNEPFHKLSIQPSGRKILFKLFYCKKHTKLNYSTRKLSLVSIKSPNVMIWITKASKTSNPHRSSSRFVLIFHLRNFHSRKPTIKIDGRFVWIWL